MTIVVKDANGVNQTISTTDDLIPVVEAIGAVDELVVPIGEVTTAVEALLTPTENITEAVDDLIPPINIIGTRTYNYASIQRVAVGSLAVDSANIAATEVMVYASTKLYILPGSSGTVTASNGIPIEAGEKFHFRITSGHKISVIRDTADGYLHIIPVVSA